MSILISKVKKIYYYHNRGKKEGDSTAVINKIQVSRQVLTFKVQRLISLSNKYLVCVMKTTINLYQQA